MKAPLENQSTELEIQFGIIVPSTNYDKSISNYEFKNKIKGTKKFLSSLFGGTTSSDETGSYLSDKGIVIDENGVLVESSTTKKQFNIHKNKIEKYIKQKQKDWKQERIMFMFEGDYYIYPSKLK